jgi:predicted histone-like DNA-binding protein
MAIKVNARETELKIGKNPGYYYVMTPELYLALNQKKVIKEAALRSGVSQGVMQACWDAAGEVIKAWATEGHSVALPGLGTIRFAVRSQAVANVEKVGVDLIKSKRVVFTPSVDIKKELAATSINITCIDRNGEIVKRVTTEGGDVEDGEDEGEQNQGGSGSGSGSGSQQATVAAPSFSGNTQFTESTQVTMSGPAGASIFYTVDGSTPTDQSLEYEEPITLSATTTVKAIAIKDGISSAVTSRTYSKVEGGGDDEPGGDDH